MALMLLPFLVLMPLAPLWLFYLAEIFNALIIVLWFTPQLNLGNPLVASSPVQALSAIRQFIWFILFLGVLYPGKLKTWTEDLFARIR
jgi:phosphatidylglycerophosphate synthase